MQTRALDYDLPPALIATTPAEPRDAARLMVVRRQNGTHAVEHRRVSDLTDYLVGDHEVGSRAATAAEISPAADSNLTGSGSTNGQPADLLIFNQSKVVPARFAGVRRGTGGGIDGLFLAETLGEGVDWRVMLESRGKLTAGEWVDLRPCEGARGGKTVGDASLQLLERIEGGEWLARLHATSTTYDLLDAMGTPPLPPYIRRQRKLAGLPEISDTDIDRYNTIYAKEAGSVAAPTAGLHFTPALLERIDAMGVRRASVTLHVGLGTFAPVRTESLEDHAIHSEAFEVPPDTLRAIRETRQSGGRVIPIGTTTVRALESLPADWAVRLEAEPSRSIAGETDLFITPPEDEPGGKLDGASGARAGDVRAGEPGYPFRFCDGLMTNFHLPQSTLLALVAALPGMGLQRLLDLYHLAIKDSYRFYSYGDAMLVF